MATIELTARARGGVTWGQLRQRLPAALAAALPLPLPQDEELRVDVLVHVDTDPLDAAALDIPAGVVNPGATALLLLRLEYALPDGIGLGVPGLRVGRLCRLEFLATYTTAAELDTALNPASGQLTGVFRMEISARLDGLRLPPELDWIQPRIGDDTGWVTLRLTTRLSSTGSVEIDAEALNLGAVALWLPGLVGPEPALELSLDRAAGRLQVTSEDTRGELSLTGRARLRPRLAGVDIPIAPYLDPILRDIDLLGELSGTLHLDPDDPRVVFDAVFDGAGVTLNLVDLFRSLTRPVTVSLSTSQSADADASDATTLGFHVDRIRVTIGKQPSFILELVATVLGQPVPAFIALSLQELSFGIGNRVPIQGVVAPALSVPLRLPHISREQLQPLIDQFRRALEQSVVRNGGDALAAGGRYDVMVDTMVEAIELLTGALETKPGIYTAEEVGGEWRFEPDEPPDGPDDLPIRVIAATTRDDQHELVVAAWVDGRWHVLLGRPRFEMKDISVTVPFRNPREIRIGGAAHIVADGPLKVLERAWLRLAMSADMIFFSFETDENNPASLTIPPLLPGYEDGEISIAQLMVGFSYARRSVAVAFAGSVRLPVQLVDALDTAEHGAGLRLPVQSRVLFRFDVMPVVVGKVVIPIPLVQFDIDLRRDVSIGVVDPSRCEPGWDGLQVIVPGVVRAALKRISYSPIIVMHASSNSDFAGALTVGDETTGFSVIVDNGFWAYGIDSWAAVVGAPILSLPFADNACLHLAFGGFGLNINLQRPIPSMSPFAIFEIIALLADPLHYEVAPRGELADTVRVSLTNAYVVLPEPVRAMFPGAADQLRRPLDITINLGTYIRLLQTIGRAVTPVIQQVTSAIAQQSASPGADPAAVIRDAIERIALDPRALTLQILNALPPVARRITTTASLGGFDASVTLVLADRATARAALTQQAVPAPAPLSEMSGEMRWDATALDRFQPKFRAAPDLPPVFAPFGPDSLLLPADAFASFRAGDLDAALQGDDTPANGVLLRAEVRVLQGQRFTFLGFVDERGRFELVTEAGVAPLTIALPGLPDPFQLSIDGRLRLSGQPSPTGARGKVTAEASGTWKFADWLYLNLGQHVEVTRTIRMELDTPRDRSWLERGGGAGGTSSADESGKAGSGGRARKSRKTMVRGGRKKRGKGSDDDDQAITHTITTTEWQPVRLEIASDGSFHLAGAGALKIFGATLTGEIDASQHHCLVNGTLRYELEHPAADGAPLLEIDVTAAARIGPGLRAEVQAQVGAGSVKVLGKGLANARLRIANDGAEIAGAIDATIKLPHLPLKAELDLDLRGATDLRSTLPSLDIEGRGRVRVRDAATAVNPRIDFGLSGHARLRTTVDDFELSAGGTLDWRGLQWGDAEILVSREWLTVSGRTTASVRISDLGGLPVPEGLGDLLVQLTIGARVAFEFDGSEMRLWEWRLAGHWLVSAQLPGVLGGGNRVVPLAAGKFATPDHDVTFSLELVRISGLPKLDPPTVTLPNVSVTDNDDWPRIELWKCYRDDNDEEIVYAKVPRFATPNLPGTHGHHQWQTVAYGFHLSGTPSVTLPSLEGELAIDLGEEDGRLGVRIGGRFFALGSG